MSNTRLSLFKNASFAMTTPFISNKMGPLSKKNLLRTLFREIFWILYLQKWFASSMDLRIHAYQHWLYERNDIMGFQKEFDTDLRQNSY